MTGEAGDLFIELKTRLRDLRRRVGNPGLRTISELAPHSDKWDKAFGSIGAAPSTISEALSPTGGEPTWKTVLTIVCGCEKFARNREIPIDDSEFERERWETLHQRADDATKNHEIPWRRTRLDAALARIRELEQERQRLGAEVETQAARIEDLEEALERERHSSGTPGRVDVLERERLEALRALAATVMELRTVEAELVRVRADRDLLRAELLATRQRPAHTGGAGHGGSSAAGGTLPQIVAAVGAAIEQLQAATVVTDAARQSVGDAVAELGQVVGSEPVGGVLDFVATAEQQLSSSADMTMGAGEAVRRLAESLIVDATAILNRVEAGDTYAREAITYVLEAQELLTVLAGTTSATSTQALEHGIRVGQHLSDAVALTAGMRALLEAYVASI